MREGEIAQGKIPSICFERVTFDELIDDFILDYKVNGKKSLERAQNSAELLRESFGGMKAVEVNTPAIKKYIEKRQLDGMTNATINRELSALKRAFNLGSYCTPPKVAQVPHIPMLKENNVRKGFIEHNDYLALRELLPEYLKPVLTFAYYSGWRKSEILGLKWKQVNLREGIVRLETGETKNNEGRTLYMEPELWALLGQLHHNRRMECLHVFSLDGQKIGSFRKTWKSACKKIGKPELLFHDLRRSGIRNMVRAGVPERVAMAISGHKTRNVFDRYNIVSQDDLKEAARKRHEFCVKQVAQLQNGYNQPKIMKKGLQLFTATP
jgi:integrase